MQKELKVDMDWRPPEGWLVEWWEYVACPVLEAHTIYYHMFPKFEFTKHGVHIRIRVMAIEDELALKLQFLLGDDRVRCKLNYGRWKAGIKDWNKLWKCKVGRDNEK